MYVCMSVCEGSWVHEPPISRIFGSKTKKNEGNKVQG